MINIISFSLRNDKSHENTEFQEKQKENEYEEVGNKCGKYLYTKLRNN